MEGGILLAVMAPGSVEARVGKVQESIFAEHGFTSAVALPPLIPVAFLTEAPAGLLEKTERGARAPWRIKTTGIAWEGGCLYLAVGTGGLWESLRDGVGPLALPRGKELFPSFAGFYAGCGDAPLGVRPLIRPVVPALSFTSGTLVILSLYSPRERDSWWREVSWEILGERPLRGRRVE